jgi:hypothetical protein
VLVVAGALLVAVATGGASSSPSSRWTRDPPRPSLTTLGATRFAIPVSYCWAYPDRPGTSACADGSIVRLPDALRWRPRVPVRLDLRLPAHDVVIVASPYSARRHGRVTQTRLHPRRIDATGRRWVFEIPASTRDNTYLLISASFAQGDSSAEIGLKESR